MDKFVSDWFGFRRWVHQSIGELLRFRKNPTRRLLAIYDMSTQPFSIGDILTVQEATLVVREQYQLDQVDFAVVYDPKNPTCSDPSFSSINTDNVLFHLASILPAAQVNPHHGSLFLFNSHAQLNRFIAAHAHEYHVWPSAWHFGIETYHYHPIFNELLPDYYRKHGAIPRLSCRSFLVDWAQAFYRDHVSPAIPVSVQIRRNKLVSNYRNLRMDCWLEFFRHCEVHYPAKFVVICAASEVDERLRECPNVVIAKDHGTNIEQDLTLIQTAALHMGAASGPCMMAVFNTKPYLIVNCDVHTTKVNNMVECDGYWRHAFATPYQRFAMPPESTEMLIDQFARMWSAIDPAEWKRAEQPTAEKALVSWLR